MQTPSHPRRLLVRSCPPIVVVAVAAAGVATASLVGIAAAGTLTHALGVAKNARVTNLSGITTTESVLVTSRGFAVYSLTGDSIRHSKCTAGNGCFAVWPPVKVATTKKLGKVAGLRGKLAVARRHGFLQVTLGGHPLYVFAGDTRRGVATGEGLRSFHGVWHVVKVAAGAGTAPTTTPTTPTTPATTYPGW